MIRGEGKNQERNGRARKLEEIIAVIRAHQGQIKQFGVKRLGIFGSLVRGEYRGSSDVDILVEFSGKVDLLDFVAFERYLSEKTGANIDLVSAKALRTEFRSGILDEVVYI